MEDIRVNVNNTQQNSEPPIIKVVGVGGGGRQCCELYVRSQSTQRYLSALQYRPATPNCCDAQHYMHRS